MKRIQTSVPAILSALVKGDFADAYAMSQPDGIKAGEAAGAYQLLTSDNLPKYGLVEHQSALEQIGFVFGKEVDEVLISVQLPKGWKKQCDSEVDPRHNKLVDASGRKRAHVFIKTTYYDYTGYVTWERRFKVRTIVEDGRDFYLLDKDEQAPLVGVVMDGHEIYRTAPEICGKQNYKVIKELENKARQWMMEKYPHADDPFAHWDK